MFFQTNLYNKFSMLLKIQVKLYTFSKVTFNKINYYKLSGFKLKKVDKRIASKIKKNYIA